MDLKMIPGALEKVADSDGIAEQLGDIAARVASKIDPPSKFEVFHKFGRSRRGAFGQAGFRGDGALAVEFGSQNNAPMSPVRNAVSSSGLR